MSEVDALYLDGIPHDIRSEKLAHAIADIDWENEGALDLRFGGDGDLGEHLLYVLDIHFARQDAESK